MAPLSEIASSASDTVALKFWSSLSDFCGSLADFTLSPSFFASSSMFFKSDFIDPYWLVNWLPRCAASSPGLSSAQRVCGLNNKKQAEKIAPQTARFGLIGSLAFSVQVLVNSLLMAYERHRAPTEAV